MEQTWNKELKNILDRAKKCTNKKRMYVYESFKKELNELNLPPEEYTQACRKLAEYLKV